MADVSVSLPVKISKLAPVSGLESTPFDSSAQVLLLLESASGEMVSQALGGPLELVGQGLGCLDGFRRLCPSAVNSFLSGSVQGKSC